MSPAKAILAALNVQAGDSLLGIDLQAARRRLEAIDWVSSATVERRLPDTLYVTLKERPRRRDLAERRRIYADRQERPHRAREPHAAGRGVAPAAGRAGCARACRRPAAAARQRARNGQAAARRRMGRAAPLDIWFSTTTSRSGCLRRTRSPRSRSWSSSTATISSWAASSAWSICGCRTSSFSGNAARPATLRRPGRHDPVA